MSVTPPGEPPPETAPGLGRVAIRVPPGLPAPGPEARAAVRPLLDALADAIQAAGGAIPLPRYLEICLDTPGLGYSSGPLAKLGAGTGALAADVLLALGELGCLPKPLGDHAARWSDRDRAMAQAYRTGTYSMHAIVEHSASAI